MKLHDALLVLLLIFMSMVIVQTLRIGHSLLAIRLDMAEVADRVRHIELVEEDQTSKDNMTIIQNQKTIIEQLKELERLHPVVVPSTPPP